MKKKKHGIPAPDAVHAADPSADASEAVRLRVGGRFVTAYALIVLTASFFIYGFNYSYSPGLFWDENYHITSAQKYVDGVFFMGDHPPLGKELIALGEVLLGQNRNIDTSSFLKVEKTDRVPEGYSFKGVRFVPSFLAVLGGVVFFFLLLELLENAHLALIFSGLYLFENAFVVHSRGAMLDSIQLFFILASLCCFVPLFERRVTSRRRHFLLGMLLGASTAVKLNALLFVLLPVAFFVPRPRGRGRDLPRLVQSALASAAGFLVIFLGSYIVHIYLTPHVVDGRYYGASPEYREILDRGEGSELRHLPLAIKEQLEFIPRYQKGVPQYDPSKPGENGSLPYTWPFMDKTIDYRFEKNGSKVRYLYLVGNPLSWLVGLASVLLATGLVLSRLFGRTPVKDARVFRLMLLFTAIYWFYMAAMMLLQRVMYLYHYFIPLICSYLLAGLLCQYYFRTESERGGKRFYAVTVAAVTMVCATFVFFSPLSYYQPLSFRQFQERNWLSWWKMTAVR